ncbi:MAG: hypothetical protein OQK51_15275 [Kangiellaceae bacterium]|nr:hypothetical protein [Kangiellaceae bacterium]
MKISSTYKKLIIVTAVIAMAVAGFFVHTLAGLNASPVVFDDPPAFVERHAAELDHLAASPPLRESGTDGGHVDDSVVEKSESWRQSMDFSNDERLVLKAILDGKSPDVLLRLFTHPQKIQRVKVASAFGSLNVKLTHHEESGFADKRNQFWKDAKEHLPDIQNALYEALITSAEEGTKSYIPYTLAWMPGQGHETVEVLAWAAKHHPDPWVRRFSVFFVVEFGRNEELADSLLQDRVHDPEYQVRKEVLDQRIRRFKEIFGRGNNA